MSYKYDKWEKILQKEDWRLPRKMVIFVWMALAEQNIIFDIISVLKILLNNT